MESDQTSPLMVKRSVYTGYLKKKGGGQHGRRYMPIIN